MCGRIPDVLDEVNLRHKLAPVIQRRALDKEPSDGETATLVCQQGGNPSQV